MLYHVYCVHLCSCLFTNFGAQSCVVHGDVICSCFSFCKDPSELLATLVKRSFSTAVYRNFGLLRVIRMSWKFYMHALLREIPFSYLLYRKSTGSVSAPNERVKIAAIRFYVKRLRKCFWQTMIVLLKTSGTEKGAGKDVGHDAFSYLFCSSSKVTLKVSSAVFFSWVPFCP